MKYILVFVIFFIIISFSIHAENEFREEKSEHFVVYYHKDIPEEFAERTLEYCERYFKEITDRLGYSRFDFWTWDERAKVYIYPDQETFVKETGQADWSGGAASYKQKIIWTFPQMAGFFDSLLPHELGHIIFREVIGENTRVPLWLEEGVASYQEEAKRYGSSKVVIKAIEENKFIPLHKLSKINTADNIINEEGVSLFYIESVSVVDFLITKYGRSAFTEFCRELRSGDSFNLALEDAFGIKDLEKLNEVWVEHLKR